MQNERYALIGLFENHIWQKSCPVEIVEGALIIDNLIGQNAVQLSLLNLCGKTLMSVNVDVFCYDAKGKPLFSEPVPIVYKDIPADKNVPFGEDGTFFLRSGRVGSVRCCVNKVILLDGTVWKAETEPVGFKCKPFDMLDDEYKAIFQEQLRSSLYAGVECDYKYLPMEGPGYWVCACGHANDSADSHCRRCGMNRTWILQHLNEEFLARIRAERINRMRAEAERERQRVEAANRPDGNLVTEEKPREPSQPDLKVVQPAKTVVPEDLVLSPEKTVKVNPDAAASANAPIAPPAVNVQFADEPTEESEEEAPPTSPLKIVLLASLSVLLLGAIVALIYLLFF